MQTALKLAQGVLYLTSPNPRVGCVIVHNNQIVGQGATQRAGNAHAEVLALQQATQRGADLSQCTVYVTLEPCSHFGRTPPCVNALLEVKPKRIVVALLDPNPQVAGRGVGALRAAGIQVDVGLCAADAMEQNPGFISRMLRHEPFFWLKLAASVDGRSALKSGESKWITGPVAREDGHKWRARSCMVLTGIGTVEADNPLLNVRGLDTQRQPLRAVLDSQLRLKPDAAILNGAPVWVFTTVNHPEKTQALLDKNATVIQLPADANGQVCLRELVNYLGTQDINEVHVEAGPRLSGALLQARVIDQLLVYMAPTLIGPGRPMVELPQLNGLFEAQRFEFLDAARVGADVRLLLREPGRWARLQQVLSTTLQAI
ncbi:MAG TPA: bifunctional diaminohydroxyphosphoribosylaminopyrimidine deaminase/5-amino-6-(5-phosphoribosylamino)uracil reductase RibD [Candidatus Paenalcaligenes intestinipullorum]|uniref:Riboflavin biosynthesis protein RibD n=1 Tax=Candidatus Paenalcaligenes intestinipullorum TaxID=2838718 RepID=A0A9D2U796_9BURK|nr:bifunctional diaminohydroxyphosphoribosylaminopyrimidine deaminase/5-amino-6-(5-phosphoribosylamino)uracil reductase RibD [Candidatus Paenalcaligenes intestinipullorum]